MTVHANRHHSLQFTRRTFDVVAVSPIRYSSPRRVSRGGGERCTRRVRWTSASLSASSIAILDLAPTDRRDRAITIRDKYARRDAIFPDASRSTGSYVDEPSAGRSGDRSDGVGSRTTRRTDAAQNILFVERSGDGGEGGG